MQDKKPGFIARMRSSMAANIIGAIVMILCVLGVLTSAISLASFTEAFKKEYSTTTYHIADTATTLINGDHLEAYLEGGESEEYLRTRRFLENYCKKISVSIIYVIMVDRSDYGSFTSIFNHVNNSVDNTSYTEWELGYKRATSDEEYRRKYKAIYEEGALYETIYSTNTTGNIHPHITTIVPVKDTAGDVAGLLCIQRPIRELRDARRPYLLTIAVSTFMVALLASMLFAFYFRSRYAMPIVRVSDEATRFAKENTKGEPLGRISRFAEIGNLAVSIDTMETDMVNHIEELMRATAEKGRIDTELSLANTIQENSIPNEFPAFPDRSEFDIYAAMTPARAVGGDFYNFFLIDDDHLAIIIGDVSGKGIPAALFMMVTNILISDRTQLGKTPHEILAEVNDIICVRNTAEMFVTVWLGILEISTGKLTAANAGHEYPAVKDPDGSYELFMDRHGFVIGGMDGVTYQEYEMHLEPGSRLFLYTDGVPEATASDGRMFGTDRMLAALNRDPEGSPETALKNVRAAVDGFVQDAEQFDDLTMLCLEYKGRGQPGLSERNT